VYLALKANVVLA